MTKTNTRGARIPDFILPLIERAVKYEVTRIYGDNDHVVAKVTDLILSNLATKEGLDWYFCAKRLIGCRHSSLCYDLAELAVDKYRYKHEDEFRLNWWAMACIRHRYGGGELHRFHHFRAGAKDAKDYEKKLYDFLRWSGVPDEFNYKGSESLQKFVGMYFNLISHTDEEAVAFWDEYEKENLYTQFS